MMHGSSIQMFRAENLSADLRKRKLSDAGDDEEPMIRPMTSVAASRKLVEERGERSFALLTLASYIE